MGRPDIVLITVDSLRADSVGFLDDDAPSTPTIDSLARESSLATAATAPSSHTRASVPAILSSQYAHRFFTEFLEDTDIQTLAQHLSSADYETAAFHSNPLLSRHFGYDRGFDAFYDGLRFVEGTRLPEKVTRLYSKAVRLLRRYPYEPAESITNRATDWLEDADSPFFLWVHYMDPHGPYALDRDRGYLDKFRSERLWHKAVSTPAEVTDTERTALREAYEDEIEYTDSHLAPLLEGVRAKTEDACIVMTGDHGEEFREHGEFTHMPKLYEEVTRVPFILDLPDGTSLDTPSPISLLDIVPTLLAQADGVASDEFAGVDVTDGATDRRHVVTETNPDDGRVTIGLRTDRYKYIAHEDDRELYDLRQDPEERTNLAGSGLDVEAELEQALADHLREHDVEGGDKLAATATEMDSEMQGRLEDLGYL